MWTVVVDLKANFPCWIALSDSVNSQSPFILFSNIGMHSHYKNMFQNVRFGNDYSSLNCFISTCIEANEHIALAFEAPMWWQFSQQRRFPSEVTRWYVNIASQATGQAYFHGYKIISNILNNYPNKTFTFDMEKMNKNSILLFEGFATGNFKVDTPSKKNIPPGPCYRKIARKLPFRGSDHYEDWVDAFSVLCRSNLTIIT